ncbi:hypothetical protein FOZ62_027579, partial [Perkinsus olseni]
AVPSTTTTEAVPSTTTTEAVPSTTTTEAGSTSTTKVPRLLLKLLQLRLQPAAPQESLDGHYCGQLDGQSFSVDFDEDGRATVSALGQKGGADYEVEGDDIIFSNYNPILQRLMNSLHVKSIKGSIISPTEIHIKAGLLIDTTLTSC